MKAFLERFAETLRAARRAAGLTQDALADALGVARSTVVRWEGGDMGVALEHLPALASALGVPISALFAASGEETAPDAAEAAVLLRALSPEARARALELLRELVVQSADPVLVDALARLDADALARLRAHPGARRKPAI
jgi:transcriptional regulator with XRE-family HTH domain